MNDHKFKLLTLAIVGVIGISIALVAPNPVMSAPPGNPPTANVSPTFSGLTVTGDISVNGEVDSGSGLITSGNIEGNGTLSVGGNSTFGGTITSNKNITSKANIYTVGTGDIQSAGEITATNNIDAGGNISSTGNISTTGSITGGSMGRFYRVQHIGNVNYAAGTQYTSATCTTGDILIGCFGNLDDEEAGDEYQGTWTSTTSMSRTCQSWARNNAGGAGDIDTVQAIATCFSPNG